MRQVRATRCAWVVTIGAALLASCASVEKKQVASEPPAVAEVELRLDYSALFDVVSSTSLYDASVIRPGLMDRVLVEGTLLAKDDNTEAWVMDLLLGWLGEHNSHIIAPPLPAELEVRAPCPVGGCSQTLPTAVLRQVMFISGTDQIAATVQREESGIIVAIRHDPDDKSLCAPDYKLPLGYVQLRALVQRLTDGALAGLVRETRLLTTPAHPVVEAKLPPPEIAPAEFCAAVVSVLESEREFRRTDGRYIEAARLMLDAALGPLYPVPETKPAAR